MPNNIFFTPVPKSEPKYNAVYCIKGIDGRLYSHSSAINNNININRKISQKSPRKTVRENFFAEYAAEIDIFTCKTQFPSWIYDFREKILQKIGKNFRLLCQAVKDSGFSFKAKYPIEVDGKWKFADIYLPDFNAVVLLANEKEYLGLPCTSKSEREMFFGKQCTVIVAFPNEFSNLKVKLKILSK